MLRSFVLFKVGLLNLKKKHTDKKQQQQIITASFTKSKYASLTEICRHVRIWGQIDKGMGQ